MVLVIGFTAGFYAKTSTIQQTLQYASAQEIENAKNAISELYKDKAIDSCKGPTEASDLTADRYELNYNYIRINKYANRAIITDCGGYSTLLAKNSLGVWNATNINVVTSNRVNPIWQKECLIDDITVADDIVRPENSSIDQFNLEDCKKLRLQ